MTAPRDVWYTHDKFGGVYEVSYDAERAERMLAIADRKYPQDAPHANNHYTLASARAEMVVDVPSEVRSLLHWAITFHLDSQPCDVERAWLDALPPLRVAPAGETTDA